MSNKSEEQEVYVLLDFQSKDVTKLLKQQSAYFRMLNLSEPKPIVELGDDIFEGIYEDVIGTNVYFEEIESRHEPDLFEGDTPIGLKYLLKQSKILKLNHIGTKPKIVIDPCPIEPVGIYVKDDYRVLLNKLKNDELHIQDYITDVMHLSTDEDDSGNDHSDKAETVVPVEPMKAIKEDQSITHNQPLQPEWFPSDEKGKNDNPTYNKHLKLLKVVEEPRKSEGLQYDTSVISGSMNFYNWKNAMMRIVEQQQINLDINKGNINHFVDVEHSIKQGIIDGPFTVMRVYDPDEKRKLFSFQNFVNLSPLMKLIVLNDCVNFEKAEIENMTEVEMQKEDEHHCTPMQRLKLLNDFKEELCAHVLLRIKDAQRTENNLKNATVTINLSDEEYSCDETSEDSNSSE